MAGALAAVFLRIPERVAATLTAFGGGICSRHGRRRLAERRAEHAQAARGQSIAAGYLLS